MPHIRRHRAPVERHCEKLRAAGFVRLFPEPSHRFLGHALNAAIHLHTAKRIFRFRKAQLPQHCTKRIVVRFFATMLQQQRSFHQRMRQVSSHRAQEQPFGFPTRIPTALRMRQCNRSSESIAALVELVGNTSATCADTSTAQTFFTSWISSAEAWISSEISGAAAPALFLHSRQSCTCEWPARSPALFSPEATRTICSNASRPKSSSGSPSWYRPALKSISLRTSSNRAVVVITLIVGTNGKFVIDPFPVANKIMLQPAATCPAMLSKSLPGLSMKYMPGSVMRSPKSITKSSRVAGSFFRAAPIDLMTMLYNPRYIFPPDGFPSAVCPCTAAHFWNRSEVLKNFLAVST